MLLLLLLLLNEQKSGADFPGSLALEPKKGADQRTL
jgi:hypothetical protein